jgi:hypothetical protein
MTAVGTSVATMTGSILSTLGDNGATRGSGAGSSVDGGFDALFSRAIQADDSSAIAGDRADTAAASLDRRAGADRQRDVVADDRRSTRVDEPTDRVTESSDRGARAETTDEPDEADRPMRARAAGDSNDPSAVAAPLVIVAPLAVQTPAPTSSDVVPSLVPATGTAATPVDAAVAQTVATTETVAPAVPGAPIAPAGAAPEATVESGVPPIDASPTTIEALAAAVGERMPTPLEAVAQPTSADATVGQQPSMAPSTASPGTSPADALSSTGQPMDPVAESAASAASAMSGVAPTSTAQSTAQAAVVADAGHDAGGIDPARPAASSTTTAVDGPSTAPSTGSSTASGTGTAAPGAGTASGAAAPTDTAVTTTATPERVTELRRMRDRAALGGVAGGAMSIDLSDEGLGPLTLHALQNASGVHLTLDAADQATRDLLSRQGTALRNELEAGGTTLGSLDIQHSGPGSSGERGAGTPSGRADRAGAPRPLLAGSATTPLATVRSRPTPSTDGVDLLI